MKIAWLLINCNSRAEADRIGNALLKQRSIACYDIILRSKAAYFWPPKSGKIETAKGAMLIAVTLPKLVSKVRTAVTRLHSDSLPSINGIAVEVSKEYFRWVQAEARK
ncbi:MAG: divalent cation tolerance protein CutA [Patescibacteria group bacterium]